MLVRSHPIQAGQQPGDCLFVRAGTLDTPEAAPPDVHICTRSKLRWVRLLEGARSFESIYTDLAKVWPGREREATARLSVISRGR
jgi:hypothetical protein